MSRIKTIGILTSGGDAPGMNQQFVLSLAQAFVMASTLRVYTVAMTA